MWFSVSDILSLCTPIWLNFPRAPSYRRMFLHRLYPAESLPPKMQSTNSRRNNAIDVINLFLCWVFNATTHGTHLHFHWIGIHLAHVLATVLHSNISYDQRPCVVIVVCHRQPIAIRDDVFVYCQYGLCVGFYPRNLNHLTHIFRTCGCLCGCVRYLCNGWMRCKYVLETISREQRKSALEKKQNRNISSWNCCFRSVDTFCLLNTFAFFFSKRKMFLFSFFTLAQLSWMREVRIIYHGLIYWISSI